MDDPYTKRSRLIMLLLPLQYCQLLLLSHLFPSACLSHLPYRLPCRLLPPHLQGYRDYMASFRWFNLQGGSLSGDKGNASSGSSGNSGSTRTRRRSLNTAKATAGANADAGTPPTAMECSGFFRYRQRNASANTSVHSSQFVTTNGTAAQEEADAGSTNLAANGLLVFCNVVGFCPEDLFSSTVIIFASLLAAVIICFAVQYVF